MELSELPLDKLVHLLFSGNYQVAESAYKELWELEPENRIYAWYLGLAQLLQDRQNLAQQTWWSAVSESESDQYQAMDDLAHFLVQQAIYQAQSGNYKSALDIRLSLVELNPFDLHNRLEIVIIKLKLKQPVATNMTSLGTLLESGEFMPLSSEELISFCDQALMPSCFDQNLLDFVQKLCNAHSQYQSQIVEFLIKIDNRFIGNPEAGIALLELASKLEPSNQEVLLRLVGFCIKDNDIQKAIAVARQLYLQAQNSPCVERVIACNSLVSALTYSTLYWQEAKELITEIDHYLEELFLAELCKELPKKNLGYLVFAGGYAPYFRDTPRRNYAIRKKVRDYIYSCIYDSTEKIRRQYQKRLNLRRQHFVLGRKLKIGYLSTSLKRHSVGYLARWLIKYHDRQKFELYCYANNQSTSDPVTAWYSQQFTKFFNEPTEDIVTIANQIQQDGIDILVDLDSITYIKGNLLLCLKPAPLQVTWLGWDAAGNNKVDYFIADPFVLPSDAEEYYVENIWRLPNTYIAVDGFEVATPSIHRELLDIPKNAVVFLSAQVSLKRHPDHARLQMEIVKRVPNSYLVLKGDGDQTALEQFFFEMADQVGVSHNRLRFLPRTDGEPEHRANYLIADVILDTYPYTGATHTLEALWMEIPMVTRVGEQFSARNSYTMMINAGITEGIAWTDEEYVEWGVRLGTDAQLRQQVAWKLKQGKHSAPIWNARQFTLEMENAYQKMWATWINSDQSQIVINPADDRDLLLSEAKLLNTEGLNFVQKGEISSAIRCWEYAIFLHPEYVDALYNLGTALSQSRQIEEAIKSFYRVIELQPNNANALYNLGLTLEKCNQLEPAINCYEQAVTIAPEDIDIHIALGGAFFKQRNWSQAINCYETALQINPDSVNALCGLGAVLIEEGRLEVAIDILQSAISINSNNAQVYCNLGHAFTKVGKMEDAAFCYAKALALNPNLANAYWNYNNDVLSDPTNPVFHNYPLRRKLADQFLATCYETDPISALVNYINNYTQSGGSDLILDKFQELEAHVLAHRENLSHMEIEVLYNNFLFTLSSLRDNLVLNTQFFRFVGKLYREKIIKVQLDYPSEPKLEPHPLRIGILSPHFGRHPVGWCSFDVIKALSKLTPHIFLYNTGSLAPDPKTDQFAQVAETFYWYQKDELKTNNINSYEDRVNWISKDMEKDDLDIILDLDSITIPFNTHLLCRPYLAPVRVSWLGFDAPFVCADNYWLGDRFTHPQGVDDLYVEQIIRLPDAHMAVSGFEVVSIDREAKRQELGISKNQIAYLFAAPARKFNRDCARACVQIIKQVPNSVLMHKGMGDREMILSVYHQECDIQGVDYDRIKYLPAYKTEEEHRAVYQIADVFLDAYPYNGGTHNIEALWSNLPVVTRSGEQSFSRMGNSFIHAAGINTGIGYSWQEYVSWGVKYGLDENFRLDVIEQLAKGKQQDSLAPLWNPQKLAEDMYAIFNDLLIRSQ